MSDNQREVERFQWHKDFECVVEILRTGTFPTTVMVKLPDDKIVETDFNRLMRRGLPESNYKEKL